MDPGNTIRLNTSLRAVYIDETLSRARGLAARLGITRVTEITRLDRIGIPVFASIRPSACEGSLCVNAGKGVTTQEACVGAWMEAIEYAVAEPNAASVSQIPVPARFVLNGRADPPAILDLCPLLNSSIPLRAEIPCVVTEEILTGQPCFVPAELVFLPAPCHCIPSYFGSTSNGIASGNTLLEATVHGLAEVIERDIKAFHLVRDTSALVAEETFPAVATALADAIRSAGLELCVRYHANEFHLPYFSASIVDPDTDSPLFIHGGFGCHPHASIALVRAICEAAQSRLSFIHGGRDDLVDWHRRISAWNEQERAEHRFRLRAKACCAARTVRYEEIPDYKARATSLESCFDLMVAALDRAGIRQICRIVFTNPTDSLCVVKIVVPLLEEFDAFSPRVGKRLRDHAEALTE